MMKLRKVDGRLSQNVVVAAKESPSIRHFVLVTALGTAKVDLICNKENRCRWRFFTFSVTMFPVPVRQVGPAPDKFPVKAPEFSQYW